MDKNKEDFKKIFKIVLLVAIVFWCSSNTGIIMGIINKLFDVFSPFILGGFLAFIINIPMAAIEKSY